MWLSKMSSREVWKPDQVWKCFTTKLHNTDEYNNDTQTK